MAYTPVEIRHVKLPRGFFGYRRTVVDRLLENVTDSFETVWRDRADLSDKVEHLESDLVRYRETETLLHTTLVSAERAAHELRDQARREAETIVNEARSEAREVTRRARSERESLTAEARRIKTLLNAALDAVDEADIDSGEAAAQHPEAA
jgi:cell division initiation protein